MAVREPGRDAPVHARLLDSLTDQAFLQRDEMRGQRLALEFAHAELGLKDRGVKSTVVVFGSARAVESSSQRRDGKAKNSRRSRRTSPDFACKWYEEARTFGRIVSERAGALTPKDGILENVITTGGGPGMMEAANRGAADAGAPTIGFNIQLPAEQEPNLYITPGLSFTFNYFAVRKMHFAMRANALAVFPGGFGTLDELFEILTLKQTRKTGGMPVVLFCKDYWREIVNFEALARHGMIAKEDLSLFTIVNSAEEGWEAMLEGGLAISTPLREI
jgi:uncharacterized protein (TIGR00730 family)